MIDNWNLFEGTEFIGVLSYNDETDKFNLELKNNSEKGIKVYNFLHAGESQERFKGEMFRRVAPRNRVNIREILRDCGLDHYDEWGLLKACNFTTLTDRIWMTKTMDGNEYYEKSWLGAAEKYMKEHNIKPYLGENKQ
ncbi:MAG: hypothetical protein IJ593_04705 [Lachnospiraceae bacterium]|nr:hypothetical protein [Lachnospiraceae bacterium]